MARRYWKGSISDGLALDLHAGSHGLSPTDYELLSASRKPFIPQLRHFVGHAFSMPSRKHHPEMFLAKLQSHKGLIFHTRGPSNASYQCSQ